MKRISILVLLILALAVALAACAPAPEVEPPHEHQFSDEWCADATYHWHVDVCDAADHEADAIASKYEHRGYEEDGVCDVCDYVKFYTVAVDAPANVTVAGDLTTKNGKDVTFTAAVSEVYELSFEGAAVVGEPVLADGVLTYTLKVENVESADVEVVISAKQVKYYNVFETIEGTLAPEDEEEPLPTWQFVTKEEKVYLKAGTYTLVAINSEDNIEVAGADEMYDAATKITVLEDGEYTINVRGYFWDATADADYVIEICDAYETEFELDGMSGECVVPKASLNVTVTVPTPGAYVFKAVGFETLFVATTEENEKVELTLSPLDGFDKAIDMEWSLSAVEWNTVAPEGNLVNFNYADIYFIAINIETDGVYSVVVEGDVYTNVHRYFEWDGSFEYCGSSFNGYAGDTVYLGILSYGYGEATVKVQAPGGAAGGDDEVEAEDLVLGKVEITGKPATYTFTAGEAGSLNIALENAAMGPVEIKVTVNGNSYYIYTQSDKTFELAAGDTVLVEVDSDGGWSNMISTWTVAGGEEGGEAALGTAENPYVVVAGESVNVMIIGNSGPVYVKVPAGVTATIDNGAYFMDGTSPVMSVTPDEDTVYQVNANNSMAGAICNIEGVAASTGDDEEPEVAGDGSEFDPYIFDGTKEIFIYASYNMPTFVTVKGGVVATLAFDATFFLDPSTSIGKTVAPAVDTTYAIIADTRAGSMGYLQVGEAVEGVVGSGSETDPFVFDGANDIEFTAQAYQPVFVVVKGGVTAVISGNAEFFVLENYSTTSVGKTVSPAEDCTYLVFMTKGAANGECVLSTEAKEPETPALENTLPLDAAQTLSSSQEFRYTAATAGVLKINNFVIIMTGNSTGSYTINGGDAVLLEKGNSYEIALAAGDVFVLTIDIQGTQFVGFTASFEEGVADEGGEDENAGGLVIGSNAVELEITGYYIAGKEVTFTAAEAGNYYIMFDFGANGIVGGEEIGNPYMFSLEAGESFTFLLTGDIDLATDPENGTKTVTFTIGKN